MSDQEPFNMMSGPPTVEDLCEAPYYCANQVNIVEALNNLFDEWPKLLGRCSLCIHFRLIDFSDTSPNS